MKNTEWSAASAGIAAAASWFEDHELSERWSMDWLYDKYRDDVLSGAFEGVRWSDWLDLGTRNNWETWVVYRNSADRAASAARSVGTKDRSAWQV